MNDALINHVALLLPSVKKAADHLRTFDFKIGAAAPWEGEGTLEIYVGDPHAQRGTLLLMEPMKEGAYTRALNKRGPGLHHIAIDVLNLESYIDDLSGSGWFLPPKSLQTIRATNTAWLARPGVPALIEVQKRDGPNNIPYFIQELRIPYLSEQDLRMFHALGLRQVQGNPTGELTFIIGGREIRFAALL